LNRVSLIFIGLFAVIFVTVGVIGSHAAKRNPPPAKIAPAVLRAVSTPTSGARPPARTPRPSAQPKTQARSSAGASHSAAATHAAATHAAAPPPVASPTQQPVVPTSAPPAPAGCYPLSNEGTCYEPGEFCRHTDHGMTGIAGDGKRIICEDNDGWRWEPA
jgi:hypothetical protein